MNDKFLLFSLGEHLFGTPLTDVAEVMEPQPVKAVPNMVAAYRGLVNVRGQVMGAVDLSTLFGHVSASGGARCFCLCPAPRAPSPSSLTASRPWPHSKKWPSTAGFTTLLNRLLYWVSTWHQQIVTVVDLLKLFSHFAAVPGKAEGR